MKTYFKPTQRRTPLRTTSPKHYGLSVPERAGKRGKYGSVSKRYRDRIYHSSSEADYAAVLDSLKRAVNPADRVVFWTPQVKIPLIVYGKLIANYYCDFEVTFADGRVELHEIKGFRTNVWLLKEKLVRAIYPDRIFKVIHV